MFFVILHIIFIMEKKYLLSLITKYSDIQFSIIDSNSFSIHTTSAFSNHIFKLFDDLFVKYGDDNSIIFNNKYLQLTSS